MHGVDWDKVYDQYHAMLQDAASREDVSFIIGEMIAELNIGHAYYSGGDGEDTETVSVGMLGRRLRSWQRGGRGGRDPLGVPDRPAVRGCRVGL